MARSVPLSRLTSQFRRGSAFFVRHRSHFYAHITLHYHQRCGSWSYVSRWLLEKLKPAHCQISRLQSWQRWDDSCGCRNAQSESVSDSVPIGGSADRSKQPQFGIFYPSKRPGYISGVCQQYQCVIFERHCLSDSSYPAFDSANAMTTMPNKSPEPTAVGAVSSAIAVHVTSRRWLSFFR